MTLTVPARPEYVHIARSVAAGVAAKAAMTLDDIEDIRLAVDEACTHLLAHSAADVLRVELLQSGESFEIVAHVDSMIDDGDERGDGSISWRILEALADSVLLERSGESASIRLSKRIS
ncbi:MAG TPA: ATP-binding protein [Actinomycetota bacterium]